MKRKKVDEKSTMDKKGKLPDEKEQIKKPFFVRFVAFFLRWL